MANVWCGSNFLSNSKRQVVNESYMYLVAIVFRTVANRN